jgi:hypothetical protein
MTATHTDVGAYSLGLLEEHDRLEFEAHLAECDACRAELAELSPLAGLLSGLGPVEEPGAGITEASITDLVHRRATAQRRRSRRQLLVAAAAGVALLAGGLAGGIAAASGHTKVITAAPGVTGTRHSAVNLASHLNGTAGLVPKAWGTQISLDLANIRGPLECQLIAVSKTGEKRIVTGWFVPAAGYGVPGHSAHLLVLGGTSIPAAELSSLDVNVLNGRTLLTIKV